MPVKYLFLMESIFQSLLNGKCHGFFFIIGRKGLIILDKFFFTLKTSHVYFLMKRQEDISTEIVEKGSKSLFYQKNELHQLLG